jgi:hypothetical protein
MNKLSMRATHVLLSGLLIATLISPVALADSPYAAKRFMQGGTFCFAQDGGGDKTVKMVVQKATGGAPNKVAHVDALMHGVYRSYFDKVTGAATIAPPNNQLQPDTELIQIALMGTSYGTDGDIENRGIWTLDYAVSLNTTKLKGDIIGVAVFNPVKNGELGESVKYLINETLAPISCDEFAPE